MNINLETFNVLEDLGQSDIYERLVAIDESDGLKLFIKKTNVVNLLDEMKSKYFDNELNVNQNIAHDNIIKFIDHKQILNDVYLLFEATNGGNLTNFFKKYMETNKKPFPEEIVQYIIKQISAALQYLHEKHIIFRNLGLEQIFLDFDDEQDISKLNISKAKIKLGNFHLSKILENNELAHSFIGIPAYMDPNILLKESDQISYEYKADIWSLGILCFELLTGTTPFDGNTYEELINNVKDGKYSIKKDLNLSKEVISFISGMLQYDVNKRFDINAVINHDFLKKDTKDFEHKGFEQFGEVKEKEIVLNINIK